MMRLPCLANGRPTSRTSPLRSCFHRCNEEGVDIQLERQIPKHSKIGVLHDGDTIIPGLTPRRRQELVRETLEPLSVSRSTERWTGRDGAISMSSAGCWLDSRAFRESCNAFGSSPTSGSGAYARRGEPGLRRELTKGERQILRRLKEKLLARYGSISSAWNALQANKQDSLDLREFVQRTSTFFTTAQAQVAYLLMDRTRTGSVTVEEMISMLEDV
eukprot:TRINITY_DN55866_c0_g1_i1.p1 TRINITY_DN55866_c0_g1~~TRINITY_DN55866_c0_g1_i1.p1  ORF type:complete len:217 (-),score=21.59 TRINITY_DN55866_c0_g1_i1:62-712(-)